MWHEARKHEKKLRGMMVDYRRRAERRREFYEKIRKDPASFLQIHGSQLKVHIDANISQAAENSLMPWMGNNDNLIDRFDVRAHLDTIPTIEPSSADSSVTVDVNDIERQINYERYRNLVQNEFLGLSESKYLHQIWMEERFGMNQTQHENQQKVMSKKKLAERKATIAYNYDDDDAASFTVNPIIKTNTDSPESEESSDEDIDFDTSVNIDQLTSEMGHRINSIAHKFGMKNDDFLRFLDEDKTEAEKLKMAKELENEKSMFTGRKSRRERRALKEQRLLILRTTHADDSDKLLIYKDDDNKNIQSSSESDNSVDETKIEFITSFGGSSEDETKKELSEKKVKQKESITKRKQKIKPSLQYKKSEDAPIIYGPTLPGEDIASLSYQRTSFNQIRNNAPRMRSYRYNHSTDSDTNRSRSRSRSTDRRRFGSRHYDNYRHRSYRRSRSRSNTRISSRRRYNRSRSRSNSRSRRYRRQSRSRSRSRERRRRNRSKSRDRTSYNRRHDTERRNDKGVNRNRKSRSVSPKRSTSKSKSDNRDVRKVSRSPHRHRTQRSSSKSDDVKPKEIKTEPALQENTVSIDKSEPEGLSTNLPSPPIKRYYRHDLLNEYSGSGSESDKDIDKQKINIERAKTTSSCNSNEEHKQLSDPLSVCGLSKTSNVTAHHERLKKKTQQQIEKQYKLDKKAERDRIDKMHQERVDREEELREMSIKLRYRRGHHHRNSRSSSRSRKSDSSSSS